jgi:uncharacterized protein (DUF433 family)
VAKTKQKPSPEPSPVDTPLYTLWDVARYLRLPVWSVLALSGRGRPDPEWLLDYAWRRWPHFNPDDDSGFPFDEDFGRVTFCRLAEFFVRGFAAQAVWELGRAGEWKKDHWLRIHESLWFALDDQLAGQSLFDGSRIDGLVDLLFARYARQTPSINREWLLKLARLRIERVEVEGGSPVRLYPFSREPAEDCPRMVVIDPLIRFGRPTVAGRGVPTDILLERFHAGDSPSDLAADYDIPAAEIDEALRYETIPVAPIYPPFFLR